jgi:hypothetical protein
MKSTALALVAALALSAGLAQATGAAAYSFTTTAEFVRDCDGTSPPEQCMDALMDVELVIDGGDNPNATCDGGMTSARDTEAARYAILAERVLRIVPWLKTHPEYGDKPFQDGVWAALKGAYCP